MKRLLAILALACVVFIVPSTALGSPPADAEQQGQGDVQGLIAVPDGVQVDEPTQQDNQGDPDDLGGGFRSTGSSVETNGFVPPWGNWIDPILSLLLHLT